MTTPKDPYLGKYIDEYYIDKLLGRGGMGSVYRGRDSKLERTVAIKILSEAALTNRESVARFDREARIIADLNNPNIAQVYRIGQIGGIPYYAMEYIEGQSLADIIKERGRIGGSRAIKIMLQIAKGLNAAAQQKIIHRDIKPANIMLGENDQVKIVDFGIAKAFNEDTFLTATGTIMGTPHYIAPEQGRGAKVDHRADIYSLGATFFHMLAGTTPFHADSAITLIQMHFDAPIPSVTHNNPNVPPALDAIIYTMMAKTPAERFQDYTELIVRLENLSGVPSTSGFQTYVVERQGPGASAPASQNFFTSKTFLGVVAAIIALVIIGSMLGPDASAPATPGDAPTPTPVLDGYAGKLQQGLKMKNDLEKIQKDLEKKE